MLRTTEDMLLLVPNPLREAASALGLPRSLVIKRIAYRAARSGLITGVLLATARVAGETAPLLFTALSNQFFSLSLTKTMANLPVTINNFVQSPYAYWKQLAWSGALLITLTVLALNIARAHPGRREKPQNERPVRFRKSFERAVPPKALPDAAPKVTARNLNFYYGEHHALKNINLTLGTNRVTAFIGPSGCGKSTLLRIFNRMYDLYPGQRAEGQLMLDSTNILDPRLDLNLLRARVGMVFQKPTPFPMTIYENIAFGIRLYEKISKSEMDGRVEKALRGGALWNEVKDKLNASGLSLSGGQQQRLCIARTVAVRPEVILFDEPCSALDPISTAKVEELIQELAENYTIAIVTHNMQQAARVSDKTAFMYLGELIEFDDTSRIFTSPSDRRTQDYITGRFG